jgi:hypothetical protein
MASEVSEENVTSIFSVEEYAEQDTMKQTASRVPQP